MSKKKKKSFINVSIAVAVASFFLSRNLAICRYHLWFLVVIAIISLFPILYVYFKNKMRGDRLFDYSLSVFCVCFSLYTITEIIYLTKAPSKYYSTEVINLVGPRNGFSARGSLPGVILTIDGHRVKYGIHISENTRNKFKNRKLDSTIFYAHGEYRYGFISTIQFKSFDLEIVNP